MNELNDEIKLTLNLMQTDIDDGAHDELQYHLACMLEIKRNEMQQRLVERSWSDHADGMGSVVKFDQAPYKSVKLDWQIADEANPLTIEEIKAGGWWCKDISSDCANALESKGLRVFNPSEWGDNSDWGHCGMFDDVVTRKFFFDDVGLKQINRIGNEFFWSQK